MSRKTQIKFMLIAPIISPWALGRGHARRQFVKVLEEMTERFESDYRKVSDKFQNHRVDYRKGVHYGRPPAGAKEYGYPGGPKGDALYGITSTGSDVMRWLDDGTKVRYMAMTPDFRSLTIPRGGLLTRTPHGRKSHFSIKPGIEPRNFSEAVAIGNVAEFVKKVFTVNEVLAAGFFIGTEIRNP